MIKHILATALMCAMGLAAWAQDMVVYNVTGNAEKQQGDSWQRLSRREVLKSTDVVRVGQNSALSVLDKKNSKVYAIKQAPAGKVQDLVAGVRNNQSGEASKYFDHMASSLFNGNSGTVSHDAAGCVYRGASLENDIARTLAFKQGSGALSLIRNSTSDYKVSFEVVDRASGQKLPGNVAIGRDAIFRIINSSNIDLYVNIMDINPEGELYDCMPADEGMTLSHLLIPANSTIDLADYPIAFSEPAGTDHLVLLALPEPFDLRVINKILKTPGLTPASVTRMGVYNMTLNIGY